MEELIRKFSFAHCSKAGAKFDYKKGIWFNHEYLMNMDSECLAQLFMPVLAEHGHADVDPAYVARAVDMIKGRIDFVRDLWTQGDFFFEAPQSYAEKDVKKRWKEGTAEIMTQLIEVLEGIDDMTSANAEKIVLDWIAANGYKNEALFFGF